MQHKDAQNARGFSSLQNTYARLEFVKSRERGEFKKGGFVRTVRCRRLLTFLLEIVNIAESCIGRSCVEALSLCLNALAEFYGMLCLL